MRVALFFCLLALALGCNSNDTSQEVALAEAQARTAEAEARAAEARAAEAAARAPVSQAPSTPPPSTPPPSPTPAPAPPPAAEPTVDYETFGRPQAAVVQTQSDGRITLRAEPRANASRVVRVVDGTQVAVLGCQREARVRTDAVAAGTPGRWCFVRTGSHEGWAFDAYLVF